MSTIIILLSAIILLLVLMIVMLYLIALNQVEQGKQLIMLYKHLIKEISKVMEVEK